MLGRLAWYLRRPRPLSLAEAPLPEGRDGAEQRRLHAENARRVNPAG